MNILNQLGGLNKERKKLQEECDKLSDEEFFKELAVKFKMLRAAGMGKIFCGLCSKGFGLKDKQQINECRQFLIKTECKECKKYLG